MDIYDGLTVNRTKSSIHYTFMYWARYFITLVWP